MGTQTTTPSTIRQKTFGLMSPTLNLNSLSGAIPAPKVSNAPTPPVSPAPVGSNVAQAAPQTPPNGLVSSSTATPTSTITTGTTPPVKGLFPTVASSLATFDPFKNPVVSDAYSKAQELNKAIAESKRNEAQGTATLLRQPIPLGDQEGQARVLQDQYLKQQQALGSELQGQASLYGAGFTGTEQQKSALGTVGGLAQPAPAEFGKTVFNPVTGQYEGGGNDFASSLDTFAKGMADNSINPSQIPSSVSSNPVLFAQLIEKAKQLNPSFNPTQWQANTQAQGQALQQNVQTGLTMQRSSQSANQALDTLLTAYKGLSGMSASNIPILNQISQSVSMQSGIGREAVSAFQGALKEARAQVNTVLAPLVGVESANATSNSLLPDNMIPSEIPQKVEAAKEYLRQRVEAFTQTGGVPQYGQNNATTNTNIWSW